MYKGKCLLPTVHPDTGELVKEGDPITISNQAQFDSLVDAGAVEPEAGKKAKAPAIAAA